MWLWFGFFFVLFFLSVYSLAFSSLETGACSVFYTYTGLFTKMIFNCQSSPVGVTKMLSYVMAQKVVESFKLVEILVAILTACRQCQLCVHLLSGIRKLPSLGGLQAVCFNFDTE